MIRELMEEENRRAQEDEKLALTAIYPEEFLKEVDTGRSNDQTVFKIRFGIALQEKSTLPSTTVIVTFCLPTTYPSSEPPSFEMKEAYGEPAWINDDHHRADVKDHLHKMFHATAGANGGSDGHGVVLFEWIEWLKGWFEMSWRQHLDEHPELVRRHHDEEHRAVDQLATISKSHPQPAPPAGGVELAESCGQEDQILIMPELSSTVYHSDEPLVDRRSVFVAHVASVYTKQDVQLVKRYLLSNPKIAKATHNILAYRIVQPRAAGPTSLAGKGKPSSVDNEVTLSDYDDDGENAAGGRLLHLLEVCKCRNVMVVVSRWYGGTLLGPDRFKHINNVARKLLHSHGYIK